MLLGMILPFLDAEVLNNKGLGIHNFPRDTLPNPRSQHPLPNPSAPGRTTGMLLGTALSLPR